MLYLYTLSVYGGCIHLNRSSTSYHHVLSLGESTGIGVRTLMQQEGQVLSMAAATKELSPEHILQLKV